jgi:signal transduction histidine kinase/CheY-like chemotaxis protein/AraC-like DNA-binding protein
LCKTLYCLKVSFICILISLRFSTFLRFWFLIFALGYLRGPVPSARAQTAKVSNEEITSGLAQSELLIKSFRNDSAINLVKPLLQSLKTSGLLDSPLGIRLRLVEAIALEQKQEGDLALERLLPIAELSRSMKMWDVYARSCLNLALIHEKTKDGNQSLTYLNLAKACIKENSLEELYPYFAIRMSSWERIFRSKKNATFYAREVLRTAPAYQLKLEEAIGHMLMSFLLPEEHAEVLRHCFSAIALYSELGDYTGRSAMLHQASRTYFARNEFDKALSTNDSSLKAAKQSIANGHEKHRLISKMYSFRGTIYKQLGHYDSAWFYLNKGHQMTIDIMEANIDSKIADINGRYKVNEKQRKIELQRKELRQRNMVLAVVGTVLVVVIILMYILYRNYRKQQAAKWMLARQKKLIQEQAIQLKTLDEAKTRLFANISHELRTPLTLITGPINKLIMENALDEKQLQLLGVASRSGAELSSLVDQLLDLGKIDAGKMKVNKKPTQLESFFQIHLSHFEEVASGKRLFYHFILDESVNIAAFIDRDKCRRILYNLLSNAFKVTPAPGTIEVSIRVTDGWLELSVCDTGPGIHPDELPHLFDRYFQSNRSDFSTAGGTGIGLTICQEYVHLFDGEILVNSSPNKGTTFIVRFPIEEASQLAPTCADLFSYDIIAETVMANTVHFTNGNDASGKPNILLVEDNVGIQTFIRFILEEEYRVTFAANGREALTILQSTSFDLIISDLMMPVMDGFELLHQLKSNDDTCSIPVIMLTARAEMEDKLAALRIGVDDYLTKPFDHHELKARIKNLLHNYDARRNAIHETPQIVDVSLPPVVSADCAWLKKFEDYIQSNYCNETLSVPEMAEDFAVSESTLLRNLKRLTGMSPSQYVQEVRLNHARNILETGQYDTISQVALKAGYKDARTFSRSFKNRFGKIPTEFLKV